MTPQQRTAELALCLTGGALALAAHFSPIPVVLGLAGLLLSGSMLIRLSIRTLRGGR